MIVEGSKTGVVSSARIYEMLETMRASGYPMQTEKIDYATSNIKDLPRCINLVKASETDNAAHAQFLSGILVAFDLTFSIKAWTEAERYKFLVFDSSMSTMHKIAKMDYDKAVNEYVDERIKPIIEEKIMLYNAETDAENKKKLYLNLLYSVPVGFRLTARMNTNYRCLRNIYKQRKDHRLPEWREFCQWIETLPYAKEFLM